MSGRNPKQMDPDRFQMKDLKRRISQLERDVNRITLAHDRTRRKLAALTLEDLLGKPTEEDEKS